MHPDPIVTTPPEDRDVEQAAHRLVTIIDDALDALLLLQPDLDRLPPPESALRGAVHGDPAYTRAERRVQDVLRRIEEQVPDALHPDVEELENRLVDGMHAACQVGWRVGLRMGRWNRAEGADEP